MFFCNDTATPEIYTHSHTLALRDALPIADARDTETSAIRAAGTRRREALRQLNADLGVSGGKVPGPKVEEFRRRAAEIERAFNVEVEGARADDKARTSAEIGRDHV